MKYPFSLYAVVVDGHKYWIAKSKVLKNCSGQGETVAEAVEDLERKEQKKR